MVDFINKLDGWLWGTPLIVLMFGTGLFLTIRSGFFQIRYFGFSNVLSALFFKKVAVMKRYERVC